MKFDGKLSMQPTSTILRNRGLQAHGPVQKFIDQETIRLMAPYTPALNGILEKSVTLGTVVGSGELVYNDPKARYHYYGKLMVSPTTGSSYAKKGEKKVLTDKDLVHNKSRHPQAGPFWFKRMKADNMEDILKGAQAIANRGI